MIIFNCFPIFETSIQKKKKKKFSKDIFEFEILCFIYKLQMSL